MCVGAGCSLGHARGGWTALWWPQPEALGQVLHGTIPVQCYLVRANLPAVKFRIVCKHLQSSICAQSWKFKLSHVASMDLFVRVSVLGEKRSTSVRVNDGVARRGRKISSYFWCLFVVDQISA